MKPFSDGYPSGLDSLTYFVLYFCKKKKKWKRKQKKKKETHSVEITDIEMCLISLCKLFPWTIFSSLFFPGDGQGTSPLKVSFPKKIKNALFILIQCEFMTLAYQRKGCQEIMKETASAY